MFDRIVGDGRAGRLEFLAVFSVLAWVIVGSFSQGLRHVSIPWLIVALIGLCLLVPAAARRIRDTGHSPGILALIALVALCAAVTGAEIAALRFLVWVSGVMMLGALCWLLLAPSGPPDPPQPQLRERPGASARVILARMKHAAAAAVSLVETQAPAFTKIGGLPDVAGAFEWPTYQGHPMAFLAQLDLAELARTGGPDWLPSSGMLYLFAETEWGAWGDDPSSKGSCAVLYRSEHDPSLPLAVPPSLPSGSRFAERRLGMEAIISHPSLDWLDVGLSELSDEELDHLANLPSVGETSPNHQVGGFPGEIQNGCLPLIAQLASTGRNPLEEPTEYQRRASKNWRLLFQLDSGTAVASTSSFESKTPERRTSRKSG